MGDFYYLVFVKYRYVYYLVFALYALWDWFHTKKIQRKQETEGVVVGFKHATVAWALKIFIVFWLISITAINVQVLHHYISQGITIVQHGAVDRGYSFEFQSRDVLSDVTSINPTQNESPIKIFVTQGLIPTYDVTAFWIDFIFGNIKCVIGTAVLVLLLLIVRPIAQKRPFTKQNIYRLRWFAIAVLLLKGSEWLQQYVSNWIVKNNYTFPSHSGMEMHEVDYPLVVILCLGLFVFAEIIKSASELKEDADLTV